MKTQTELNADTLFAFQMALKGHKQFEYQSSGGNWHKKCTVSNSSPHRIYHDIPDGWERSYGDWKGDKDTVLEEVMFYDGEIAERKKETASYWMNYVNNSFADTQHKWRIYAYKLAAKSPEIPEGFTVWNGGDCPIGGQQKIEYIQRNGNRYAALAGDCNWFDRGYANDIIAYRVIEKKVIP